MTFFEALKVIKMGLGIRRPSFKCWYIFYSGSIHRAVDETLNYRLDFYPCDKEKRLFSYEDVIAEDWMGTVFESPLYPSGLILGERK